MADEAITGRFRLPFVFYVVVGVLAVFGLISIWATLMSAVAWVIKLVIMGAVGLLILSVLKRFFWGRPSTKPARVDKWAA